MTKKEEQSKIVMVKLYNRLSHYFCSPVSEQTNLNVSEDMTIEQLQKLLDNFYEESVNKEKEKELKKIKFKNKQV